MIGVKLSPPWASSGLDLAQLTPAVICVPPVVLLMLSVPSVVLSAVLFSAVVLHMACTAGTVVTGVFGMHCLTVSVFCLLTRACNARSALLPHPDAQVFTGVPGEQ